MYKEKHHARTHASITCQKTRLHGQQTLNAISRLKARQPNHMSLMTPHQCPLRGSSSGINALRNVGRDGHKFNSTDVQGEESDHNHVRGRQLIQG